MYSCSILADSLSPEGVRLTTIVATYPRFIHSELLTHRMFSRNAASSRAMPTERIITQVADDPFIPQFNARVKGMGVGAPLPPDEAESARQLWLSARDAALEAAQGLLHVDKSRVNRLLEPFSWITTILTATEWGHFFKLRTDPSAQPEFQKLALMMQEEYDRNTPWACPPECWHLPLVDLDEVPKPIDYHYWKMVSTGRCARVSYLTHDGRRDPTEDVGLHNRLYNAQPPHHSPFEHVARPFSAAEWQAIREEQSELRTFHLDRHPRLVERWCRQLEYCGNLRGWHTYRSEIPNEHDSSLIRRDGQHVPS